MNPRLEKHKDHGAGRRSDISRGSLRGLIRTKRRLIELLNKQKQAIIHHAVTRGLDPDVRLKPSGMIGSVTSRNPGE